jgi:hypothetical protein
MSITEFVSQYCGTTSNLQACLQGIYNLLVAIAVVVAFFMFLFGAFENLLSTIPDVKMQGKNRMKNAIIGLGIIFITGIVLYWINPYIFSARLIMYQITNLEVPLVVVNTTTSYNINGVNYTFEVPTIQNLPQIDAFKTCIGTTYRVRMTTYYIPIINETKNNHEFLSDVTLEGKGIVLINNNKISGINYTTAEDILRRYRGDKPLVKCKSGWRWSWVKYATGTMKKCNPILTQGSSQKESVKTDLPESNRVKSDIETKSSFISLKGAYGPLIPLRTVAYNRSQGVFQKGDVIRVLECEGNPNCRLKETNLIVTDTGAGESEGADAWLDLFAGIGKNALNTAQTAKTTYVKVCKVGRIQSF